MSTPAVTPLSVDDFAAKVKAKYPEYSGMDNGDLAQRIIAKYPEYSDKVSLAPTGPPNAGLAGVAQPAAPAFVSRLTGNQAGPLEAQGIQNYIAKDGNTPLPGSFEGHPENIGQYVPATAGRAAEGAVDISRGNIKMGLNKGFQAVSNAVAPMAPMAAAGATLPFLRAAVGGLAGSKAASAGYGLINPTDTEGQQLAGNVGGLAGSTAGVLSPKLANMIPSKSSAGALFSEAQAGAGKIPVDVSAPGDTALQIRDMAGRGGTMPKVVRDFINRATDPDKGPMTYEEARDFYQNASRLSVNETQRLSPNLQRMVGQFTRNLGNSIQGAANQGGVGAQYSGAMKQYKQAATLQDNLADAGKYLGRQALEKLPWLAAVYGAKKVYDSGK